MNRPAVRRSPNAAHRQVSSRRGVYKSFNALSLDACRSKRISHVPGCALARHPPVRMRFLRGQMRFRSAPVDPIAFPMCSGMLSFDACRSRCKSYVVRCALARQLSIVNKPERTECALEQTYSWYYSSVYLFTRLFIHPSIYSRVNKSSFICLNTRWIILILAGVSRLATAICPALPK